MGFKTKDYKPEILREFSSIEEILHKFTKEDLVIPEDNSNIVLWP